MKKLIIPQLILFFVFLSFSDTSARTYWRTYIIDEITNEGIILKDFEGKKSLAAGMDHRNWLKLYNVGAPQW
ncbi:MAG: hypothetical protein P8Y04_05055 [Desulfobulbaceae bacterium]